MELVPISNNKLINPSHIGCVEQVEERGSIVLYIYVDGYRYEYEYEDKVPIAAFLNIINKNLQPDHQMFVG